MEYFLRIPLHTPDFGTPLIGPKLVGFLVGRTIRDMDAAQELDFVVVLVSGNIFFCGR